jgi:hypothetical protein
MAVTIEATRAPRLPSVQPTTRLMLTASRQDTKYSFIYSEGLGDFVAIVCVEYKKRMTPIGNILIV